MAETTSEKILRELASIFDKAATRCHTADQAARDIAQDLLAKGYVINRIGDASDQYADLLTLYSLYRLRETENILQARILFSLIHQLEEKMFPACFAPDFSKVVARARSRIEALSCAGRA